MKSIAFIIPLFNEGKRIDKTFAALQRVRLPHGFKLQQVIFVNDGSTDNSVSIIENSQFVKKNKTLQIKLVTYKQNRGKGYAIRAGLKESEADYSLIVDADMSTELSELKKFAKHMNKGIDLVIGTRKNGHSTVIEHQPLMRELLGKGFTLLTKLMLGLKGTDFTCGFKALSSKARVLYVTEGKIDRWGYDAELIYITSKYNLSSAEVPVIWSNDARTKVRVGSAIVTSLVELVRIRLNDLKGSYRDGISTEPVMRMSNINVIGRK